MSSIQDSRGIDVLRSLGFKMLIVAAVFSICTQGGIAGDTQTYDALMKSAAYHSKIFEPEKAIIDLTAAIKLHPKEYLPYHMRSEAYGELNLYQQELADMTRAIQCMNVCPLYRDRGYIHFRYGHFREAVADYTKALSLTPGDHIAYRSRARAYDALKDNKAAISDYEMALKTMNRGSIRMEPEIMDTLGKLYLKTKQEGKALDRFSLLIKRYPNMGRGYYGRAQVYKMQGQSDLAAKDLHRAHELDYAVDPGLQK